jgi:hypothetical protein
LANTTFSPTVSAMPQCEHNVVNSKGKFISGGLSGVVELLPSDLIIKSPWPGSLDSLIEIANEFEIYNHLGPHRRLVPVKGYTKKESSCCSICHTAILRTHSKTISMS